MDRMKYFRQVDFTKDFQSFRFKWSVGKMELKSSRVFSTKIIDGDKNTTINWNLEIGGPPRGRYRWFGLSLESFAVVPAVFRVELSRPGGETLHQESFFEIFNPDKKNCGCTITADIPNLTANDYVVRCYMDIPKGILSLRNVKNEDGSAPKQPTQQRDDPAKDILQRDIAKLFDGVLDGGRYSDVTLIIMKKIEREPGASKLARREIAIRRFNCHRSILATRSAFFETLLSQEDKENTCTEIEINDVDEKATEIVLRYIYTCEVPDGFDDDKDSRAAVMYAANKYGLDYLKNYCLGFMMFNEPVDPIEHLRVADQYKLDELKAICLSELSIDLKRISDADIINGLGGQLTAEITAKASKWMGVEEISLN